MLDFAQIVAFGWADHAEHNEIEGEDSRDQNRRADMYSTSENELRRKHDFSKDAMPNDQCGK